MLSVGSRARRFSPSQNIRVKSQLHTDLVMYITDNIPKLVHDSYCREAEMASPAGSYSCCRGSAPSSEGAEEPLPCAKSTHWISWRRPAKACSCSSPI